MIALINGQEIDSFDSALYEEVWHFVQESPGSSGTRIEENVSGKNSRIRTAVQWLTSNGFLEQSKKGNGTHYRTEKVLKDAIEWRSRGDYFPLI